MEHMDMHLVWTKEMKERIFLKPIPRILLNSEMWRKIFSEENFRGREDRHRLYKCAVGFLLSYAALISYEIDFRIAQDKHLIPEIVTWPRWRLLVEELLYYTTNMHDMNIVEMRFIYGELRRSRLDIVHRLGWLAPVATIAIGLTEFIQSNLGWLASATVYVAVILTAMQLGLSTKFLTDNDAFHSASYGFTIFCILGPLVLCGLVSISYCIVSMNNLVATIIHQKERLNAQRPV